MGAPVVVTRRFAFPVERVGMCVEAVIGAHPSWALGEVDREGGRVEATVRLAAALSMGRVAVRLEPAPGATEVEITLAPGFAFAGPSKRRAMLEEIADQVGARLDG